MLFMCTGLRYFILSHQYRYCFRVSVDTLPTVRSLTLPPSLRLYRSLPRGNKEQCPFKNQFGTDPPPPTPTAILFCHRIRVRASERWSFRGENNIFSTWVVPFLTHKAILSLTNLSFTRITTILCSAGHDSGTASCKVCKIREYDCLNPFYTRFVCPRAFTENI